MSAEHEKSPANELKLSHICLEEAEAILKVSPRVAAREAYLAMLHAAHARIAAAGRKVPTSHKGVNVVLGDIYRGSDFHAQSLLAQMESWKMAADYGHSAAANFEEAREAIGIARSFIGRLENDIGPDKAKAGIDPAVLAALAAKSRGQQR
jgi:uncharacterized protein (UPF0332 family)